MYQYPCPCQSNGLGFLPELLSAGASILGAGGSGGSGSSAAPISLSTQISPQISPVFQQQFQPSNSAMSAGTAQSLPGMPTIGAEAGGIAPGYALPVSTAVPTVPQAPEDYTKYLPYALAGIGMIVFLKWSKNRRGQ